MPQAYRLLDKIITDWDGTYKMVCASCITERGRYAIECRFDKPRHLQDDAYKEKAFYAKERGNRMTDEERVRQHLAKMSDQSYRRCDSLWSDVLHDDAMLTRHGRLSPAKQNRLAFDALALCGNPYCQFSRTIWSASAWKFFEQFTKGEA